MPNFKVIIRQLPDLDEELWYGDSDSYSVTDGGVLKVVRDDTGAATIFSPSGWSRIEAEADEEVLDAVIL